MAGHDDGLEDKVVQQFYKLSQDVRGIADKPSIRTLHDLIHEAATTYYHKNKDNEKGHLKFKNDQEARKFAGNLWDKSAEHVAQKYLKMSANVIKELKASKDEDGNSSWDSFMAPYLGVTKEGFQDRVSNFDEINPRQIYDALVKPMYEGHINYRTSQRVKKDIKTAEDANNVVKYLSMLKNHNPKLYREMSVPKKVPGIEQASQHFVDWISRLPDTYDPKKKETYNLVQEGQDAGQGGHH